MRKILILAIISALLTSSAPAFAGGTAQANKNIFQSASDMISDIGKARMEQAKTAKPMESVFQNVKDDVCSIGKNGPMSAPSNSMFQKVKEGMDNWNSTSDVAKTYSLRGNKEELARRRGMIR
ncbi:MAG: hypothetical protein JW994_05215 [Candidatus Omnitrophica bacterium]|nr:hypothetical protein [Candidatus Omnitrophota bacterium]